MFYQRFKKSNASVCQSPTCTHTYKAIPHCQPLSFPAQVSNLISDHPDPGTHVARDCNTALISKQRYINAFNPGQQCGREIKVIDHDNLTAFKLEILSGTGRQHTPNLTYEMLALPATRASRR